MTIVATPNLVSFPEIEAFYQVKRAVANYPALSSGTLTYKGKVKIHGTNAGVQITSNGVFAQSRSTVLTGNNDNAGFSAWVEKNKEYFNSLYNGQNITIFGEWCGPGIMKGTAINKIANKVFAIFMIQVGINKEDSEDSATVIVEPYSIFEFVYPLPKLYNPKIVPMPKDILVIPWYGEELQIDWHNADLMNAAIEKANKAVAEVEQKDPFVFEKWGVEGIGEGIVYYPVSITSRKHIADLMFKAKGEKHKVVATKQAVQIDPEVAKSIEEFVKLFVTEARLEQGFNEVCKGVLDMKLTGSFIGWVSKDVEKESKVELADSGLNWDQINKAVQIKARNWYINKSKN